MILACDLDGVLCDGQGPLLDRINAECGTVYGPDDLTDYLLEPLLVDYLEQPRVWLDALFCDPDYLRELPLMLPMLVTLREITAYFTALHIVTARHPQTKVSTRLWLDRYGVPYDKLVMTEAKAGYCRDVGARYIIEDAPHQALACLEHGIGVFLVDMPYNRDIPTRGGLWRVNNPLDIIPILKKDLARAG